MCGRLVLTSSYKEKIKAIFDGVDANEWQPPRYNVTPGTTVPVLSQQDPVALQWLPWGYEQKRTGEAEKFNLIINARAETIHNRHAFKDAFHRNRCIIFADGFYEWHRSGKGAPQPYFFEMKNHGILPLAGLLLSDRAEDVQRGVILTTEANSLMHPVHHRMPVIFTPASARTWLTPETSMDTLLTILQPFPSGQMSFHPVSRAVNKASTEGANLIERIPIVEQTDLF